MPTFAPPAASVRDHLQSGPNEERTVLDPESLARALLRNREDYGISRIGSVTRLDRIGIPVVQVVRPLARSNAVTQGKGTSLDQATISGIMEALEMWAGEHVPAGSVFSAPAAVLDDDVPPLYGPCRTDAGSWEHVTLDWMMGYDLISSREVPVPVVLVDTCYTLPSPHPAIFPRTTTGMGAGQSLLQAFLHAALEILEKDAVASARRRPFFFDRWGVNIGSVDGIVSEPLVARIRSAGLLCGIWQVPASHDLPIYWCRIMEEADHRELAPLPADGFGCDFTHDGALTKALLEACQARAGAIAAAREDITRRLYPLQQDRGILDEWRAELLSPDNKRSYPSEQPPPRDGSTDRDKVVQALKTEGAMAALVVPLYRRSDPPVEVIRLVVPGLRHGERS
jgi:ribosomal protein S12 methylthiotransferase accessory factor